MYKLQKEDEYVLRKSDSSFIPSTDKEYQAWVASGGIPEPSQTFEESALNDKILQVFNDIADVKLEAKVIALAGKSKAQVRAMADNISNLEEAKDIIKTILIITRVLAKSL
jgi:siroheme synthase (precorrin-2 oxidase/ferrochelatase)